MHRIRKSDKVIVLTGRDKGKQGAVLRVFANGRVLVEGVNMVKRHTRPNPNRGVTGGIVDKEAPLHISNVGLVNPANGRGARLGFRRLADGTKVRYFKKTGEVADVE